MTSALGIEKAMQCQEDNCTRKMRTFKQVAPTNAFSIQWARPVDLCDRCPLAGWKSAMRHAEPVVLLKHLNASHPWFSVCSFLPETKQWVLPVFSTFDMYMFEGIF